MNEKRSGRIVVVTGGSAGVGRACVRAFAKAGDDVAVLARGEDGLEGARREVEALGRRCLAIPTDVAEFDQVEAAARRVEEELGPIDVWVNDAMTTVFAPIWEIEPAEFERATRVTYLGTVWGTQAALKRMLPRDRGTIVQVGSALAYRSIPLQAPYCGAKHAVHGFTDAVRTELRHEKSRVHVTMVQLPGLNTPQFDWCEAKLAARPQPLPPIYAPEVAADAVLFASRARRREVWVGGSSVLAILAQRIAPDLVGRYLARRGWEGQLVQHEPARPDRPSNLFEPVPGDPGAHGRFDARSHGRSVQFELSKHRGVALAGAGLVAGIALAALAVRDDR